MIDNLNNAIGFISYFSKGKIKNLEKEIDKKTLETLKQKNYILIKKFKDTKE